MKKLYIIFLIAAGLIIAAYFFIRFYLQADIRNSGNKSGDSSLVSPRNPDSNGEMESLFITKLQQLVKQGSKGLYDLAIDNMEIDLLQSRVILQNVQLLYDDKVLAALDSSKQAPDDVFKASFDTLKINGINLDDVLSQKNIDFKEILITGPTIEVFHTKRAYNPRKTVDSLTLYDRIMKEMESIVIGKLVIQKGTFISHNLNRKNKETRLRDVEVQLTGILIDSSTEHATDRFLFAREASLSLKNYETKTKDDLYTFKIGALNIEAPQQTMTIHNLSLAPRFNKQQFQKQLVRQKEQYDLKLPKVTVQNIDWWSFIHEERFVADDLNIPEAIIKIYLDRTLPRPKSKMGFFPHQLIMKLPIQVNVASMHTRNLELTYEEYSPKSTQAGSLHLDHVNLDISGITNMPLQMRKKKQMVISGTARFKEAPVKARFAFDLLNYKTGRFSSTISTGGFEGNILNDIAQPLGLLKIEKGTVKEFHLDMQGDERQATGKVILLYNDFKVSLYKKGKDEPGLEKKGLVGFLANAFVLKDDNPTKNQSPRNPQASFQRNPQTGFFNLVWKTALTGILKTIGASPKLAEK